MTSRPTSTQRMDTMSGRPDISMGEVANLLEWHYGMSAEIKELTGERDSNFHVLQGPASGFVLKLAHPEEQPEVTDLQIRVLAWLNQNPPKHLDVPKLCPTLNDELSFEVLGVDGRRRTGRLLTYVCGEPLRGVPSSLDQVSSCGRSLASLAKALKGFEHPAASHSMVWDLRNAPSIRPMMAALLLNDSLAVVERLLDRFEIDVLPRFDWLRHQVIHGDFNRGNILVDCDSRDFVTGVIDFGDVIHSAVVADVAIGIASHLSPGGATASIIKAFVSGYDSVTPLTREELGVLPLLIAVRVAMTSIIPLWHRINNPGNRHYERVNIDYSDGRIALIPEILSYQSTSHTGRKKRIAAEGSGR